MPAASRQPSRAASAAVIVAGLLAVAVLAATVVLLVRRAARLSPMTPYVAPQYWLSYSDGFVRRGLHGAALRALAGGEPPTLALVNVVAVGLTVVSLVAVLVLAVALARRAPDRWTAVALAVAVVATPLGPSHVARDLGRPDALGLAVAVVLVTVPWARLPPPVAALVVALLTSVTIGTEELLAVLVLPLGWLALHRTLPRSPRLWPTLAVLPGVGLTAVSVLLPPPPAALARARADAAAAGVPAPEPLPGGPPDHDAVARLGHGLLDNMTSYYATTSAASVLVTAVLWATMHLLLLGVVWRLLGRSLSERTFWRLVAGSAAVALTLSVAGIDYRRWWALAALGALCLVVLMTRDAVVPVVSAPPVRVGTAVALVVLAVTGLLLRTMPVLPLRPVHLERLLQALGWG
ncbi:hypothetical protein GCM10009616_03020 [Microlunatus lacustris]